MSETPRLPEHPPHEPHVPCLDMVKAMVKPEPAAEPKPEALAAPRTKPLRRDQMRALQLHREAFGQEERAIESICRGRVERWGDLVLGAAAADGIDVSAFPYARDVVTPEGTVYEFSATPFDGEQPGRST